MREKFNAIEVLLLLIGAAICILAIGALVMPPTNADAPNGAIFAGLLSGGGAVVGMAVYNRSEREGETTRWKLVFVSAAAFCLSLGYAICTSSRLC